ncbi:hypothetical protein SRHO_G00000350 [Serrasalmus rhombeus]
MHKDAHITLYDVCRKGLGNASGFGGVVVIVYQPGMRGGARLEQVQPSVLLRRGPASCPTALRKGNYARSIVVTPYPAAHAFTPRSCFHRHRPEPSFRTRKTTRINSAGSFSPHPPTQACKPCPSCYTAQGQRRSNEHGRVSACGQWLVNIHVRILKEVHFSAIIIAQPYGARGAASLLRMC